MPFLRDKDRSLYDKQIDELVEQLLKIGSETGRKPHTTYVLYKLLLKAFDDPDKVYQMFQLYGVIEATRMNLDKYFQNVEQTIESKRWLDRDGER